MPVGGDVRTKIFDTFVIVAPEDRVTAAWRSLELPPDHLRLLDSLLASLTYFGRAESWVVAKRLDFLPDAPLIDAVTDVGQAPPDTELVRTLCPSAPEEHAIWYQTARAEARARRLDEITRANTRKGTASTSIRLSEKDEAVIDSGLPTTIFDALHADTAELRAAGWSQPPGSRWERYALPTDAFMPVRQHVPRKTEGRLPTVARLAVCGRVRPRLTDTIIIGDRARRILMGCSKRISGNVTRVFSGKNPDGTPLLDGHRHAHFLCESYSRDRAITHLNIFAPMGFEEPDLLAIQQFAATGIWGRDGYDLKLVLLGFGGPEDFGGIDQQAGHSRMLATSARWISRTPFIPARHLAARRQPGLRQIADDPVMLVALTEEIRRELSAREIFNGLARFADIRVQLDSAEAGTFVGGTFTPWRSFRTVRPDGHGRQGGRTGFGCQIMFRDLDGNPVPVSGPISLGFGSHFGLGAFEAL
jgi:CRISPR-associated protein Csb2